MSSTPKKYGDNLGLGTMRDIMERIINKRAQPRDLIYVSEKMAEFKLSDEFIILLMNAEAKIKVLLTEQRPIGESSEYRLGQMTGIQNGFEDAVNGIIFMGESMKKTGDELEDPNQETPPDEENPDPRKLASKQAKGR